MNTRDAAAAKPKGPGPVSRVLNPIRGQLIVAAALAGVGAMLTLVPLAGIAHIAKIVLGGTDIAAAARAQVQGEVWWTVIASVVSLFVGMALVSAGELTAHVADNRITHHLRLAATQRLARVPLGWFTSRASGEVKQAMQDDIGTLHSLTAHFYTTVGRAVGAILISVIYLFAMDWRMAIVSILPFPAFFLFFGRAMNASGANMKALVARRLPRGSRCLRPSLHRVHPSPRGLDGQRQRDDRAGGGAGRGAGLRHAVREPGLDYPGGRAAVRSGGTGPLGAVAAAALHHP
ncbi:ABC transporter transmembrane domain-containing protein [Cupriavidus basilensis]|uniref:ABC transporter transmembrane domain-containing protein n=1 Tax=Cupriavidus basilensis TaxID=68895 RepID=UPI001ED918F4|nr:ABC transporter transmembrane domain-containing protein [Cupriavidus basilensis]